MKRTVWDPGSQSLPYCTEQGLRSRDFHVTKPSIDKTSKEEEEEGGACLGPGIITHLQARQPTHMSKVNTRVRGHRSTDRHDEWPEVPTRRHAYKPARRERKVMCGQTPPHHCNTENPIHTPHRPSMSHHYLSQQWHCNTIRVCMWLGECAYMCGSFKSLHTEYLDRVFFSM